MAFTKQQRVRFAHVDAAGIVFYPRYLEMLNAAVEDWFASFGHDFREMHINRGEGVPSVHLSVDFAAPSELGDLLEITLASTRLGRSSLDVAFTVRSDGDVRATGKIVLVYMDLETRRALPWPEDLSAKLQP
jgi:4-hydroxybenzoyl-CoA thioesterase